MITVGKTSERFNKFRALLTAGLVGPVLVAALLVPAVLLTNSAPLTAQATEWARQFGTPGPDQAGGVAVDARGNVYVAGQTSGTMPGQAWGGGLADAYLKKYDASGKDAWLRQFGGNGDDAAHAVAVDDSGSVYAAGKTGGESAGALMIGGVSGAFLHKFGPDGTQLWREEFGFENFATSNSVAVGPEGNVYVVGSVKGALPGQIALGPEDAFVRKYGADGIELWTVQLGGLGADFASDVAVNAQGDVYVSGWNRNSRPGQGNFVSVGSFVSVLDKDGLSLWSVRLDAAGFSQATAVDVDAAGNVYVSGWVSGVFPGQVQVGATDAFLGKYGPSGETLWLRQFGTPDEERARDVAVGETGAVYVVGWTRGVFPGQSEVPERTILVRRDGFIRMYDRAGEELWTRQFGTASDQSANSVATDGAGGLMLTGETSSPLFQQGSIGGMDVFLARLSGGPAPAPSTLRHESPSATQPVATPMPAPTEAGEVGEAIDPLRRRNPTGFCRFSQMAAPLDSGWGLLALGLLGLATLRRRAK